MRRTLLALVLFLAAAGAAADERYFRFEPPDGTRFVRTLTRTARFDAEGMMRVERTVFRARFVFRKTVSGYTLTMTPLSFRYEVNEREVATRVWDRIRGHDLTLKFNEVGKVIEAKGYDAIDQDIVDHGPPISDRDFSAHLDRSPIGEDERENWDRHLLFWLNQTAVPGKPLSFDSKEPGYTGELVNAHAEMKVLRLERCGAARCAATVYTMRPDADALSRQLTREYNAGFLGTSASEKLEQLIEPATMLPHFERLTWQSSIEACLPDGQLTRESSLPAVSEFEYEAPQPKKH